MVSIKVEEMEMSNKFNIGSWLITANWLHPIWNQWLVSCVTLADFPNTKPATKQNSNKTHEICVHAIRPDSPIKYDHSISKDGYINLLTPTDQCLQLTYGCDALAREKLEGAIEEIKKGILLPDEDYRSRWEDYFGVTSFTRNS